jgi:hypothetical protein
MEDGSERYEDLRAVIVSTYKCARIIYVEWKDAAERRWVIKDRGGMSNGKEQHTR